MVYYNNKKNNGHCLPSKLVRKIQINACIEVFIFKYQNYKYQRVLYLHIQFYFILQSCFSIIQFIFYKKTTTKKQGKQTIITRHALKKDICMPYILIRRKQLWEILGFRTSSVINKHFL